MKKLLPFFLLLASSGFAQVDSHVAIQSNRPQVSERRPTLDVRDFHGESVGAQIQAAHDSSSCPSAGCIIDLRGLGPTATINGLNITKPVRMLFGATSFRVTSTITLTNVTGCVLEGVSGAPGMTPTSFSWQGNKSTPMFRLISVAWCTFRDFNVNTSNSFPLTAFFTSERGATGNPTNNAFYDIYGNGTNGGVIDGFHWLIGAGGDKGNDVFIFGRVVFSNYSNSAWNSNGSTQSQSHTFIDCGASGNGIGRYGFTGPGAVFMYNMSFGANSAADIFITYPSNGVLLSGGLSIGSNRLYDEIAASAGFFTVTIQNFDFANTGLNADGKVAIFRHRGPYLLLNDNVTGSSSLASQFSLDSSAPTGMTATAIGTHVLTNLANPFTTPPNMGADWVLIGNTINNGSPTMIQDQSPHGITTPVSINCTNVTPITVNANVTTDQNLMACTLPAAALNFPGKTLRIWGAGVYTTTGANTSTITIKAKLCTISGCRSGTVISPVLLTSAANAGGQRNNVWTFEVLSTTQTTGVSAAFEAHGNLSIELTGAAAVDSVFTNANMGTVGTINVTAPLFLQITGAFSVASGSNSFTQRQMVVDLVN